MLRPAACRLLCGGAAASSGGGGTTDTNIIDACGCPCRAVGDADGEAVPPSSSHVRQLLPAEE